MAPKSGSLNNQKISLASKRVKARFPLHHPSFIIHNSSSIIHNSSFIIHHSSFTIHQSSFIIHHSQFTIKKFLSTRTAPHIDTLYSGIDELICEFFYCAAGCHDIIYYGNVLPMWFQPPYCKCVFDIGLAIKGR